RRNTESQQQISNGSGGGNSGAGRSGLGGGGGGLGGGGGPVQWDRGASAARSLACQYQQSGRGKSEIRSTKSETNPKSPTANAPNPPEGQVSVIGRLSFCICFGFRASYFGFGRSARTGGVEKHPVAMGSGFHTCQFVQFVSSPLPYFTGRLTVNTLPLP